jgi:glycine/D-amino acid oxidase-like deaminating enzyme
MKKQHILIIGGGLAGICLAIQCIDAGHSVTLIDKGINRSSIVAAGMINPLVFRRMTKSWRVDEFIPYSENFYRALEHRTGTSFFHPIVIRRCIASAQEADDWKKRANDPSFRAYIHPFNVEDAKIHPEHRPFGSARVNHSAYVAAEQFMAATKAMLQENATYIDAAFDFQQFDPTTCTYLEQAFDQAIFCEGSESVKNPFFEKLPVEATKGEILTIKAQSLPQDESLNRKCFCLPVEQNTFRVGATYVWHTNNVIPTAEGKALLLENLQYLTDEDVEVIDHRAGVRPTTPDRRPIMGTHPTYPMVHIFNGLGAKGYMMAPLLSEELLEHIVNGKPLDREVDLKRFFNGQ